MTSMYMQLLTAYTAQDRNVAIAFAAAVIIMLGYVLLDRLPWKVLINLYSAQLLAFYVAMLSVFVSFRLGM